MKIDLVFSGGGVKAYAFIGSLQRIKKSGFAIERVAGTSAGAIIASLLAAGYEADELEAALLDLNVAKFLDAPFLSKHLPFVKWIMLYFKMGLYKGDAFEKFLFKKLAEKGVKTFADIEAGYLKIIVSDISLGRLIVIPDDLESVYGIDPNNFNIARAVRMSASFPYFFMPEALKNKQAEKSVILDGGILSNFPLWVFRGEKQDARPVLGITLSDSLEALSPAKVNNAIDMLQALFSTMLVAHDSRYISKSKEANVIFIPVKEVKTMHVSLSKEDKKALIHLGDKKTEAFFKSWP